SVPYGSGLFKHHLDRMIVELTDAQDILICASSGASAWVGGILPGEEHILGGEGLTIVPDDLLLQAPQGPGAVRRAVTLLNAGEFRRQNRDEFRIGIHRNQRFVDNT